MLQLHPLLRQALAAMVPPDSAGVLHAWAAEYWRHRAGGSDPETQDLGSLGLAWYHRRYCDRSAAMREMEQLREQAFQQGRTGMLQQLLDWWQPISLADDPSNPDDARDLESYGRLLERLARLSGRRSTLLPRAIDSYRRALRALDTGATREDWAGTQDAIGRALLDLPIGDPEANVQAAIGALTAALQVRTESSYPDAWAETTNSLGIAYRNLPRGNRIGHLQRAIACYESTLRVWTEVATPEKWAQAQTNLGEAYKDLPSDDGSANVERAIDCYQAALRVVYEAQAPVQWAGLQNNLANALAGLERGDRQEHLERAAEGFRSAMQVWTQDSQPDHWARAQSNLGEVYRELSAQDAGNGRDYLSQAIACFDAALGVHSVREYPLSWAIAQHNRAATFAALAACGAPLTASDATAKGTATAPPRDAEHDRLLAAAITGFNAAERVFTESTYPRFWAQNEEELARVYELQGDSERAKQASATAIRGYQAIGDEHAAAALERRSNL
jgi:tetratricopeptide (TPR) repeat protein